MLLAPLCWTKGMSSINIWAAAIPVLKYHATKTYEGTEIKHHTFLTWAPDGCKWVASLSSCFIPWERKGPGILWAGDLMGPRTGLNVEIKRETHAPGGNWTPVVQPVAGHCTDQIIPVLICNIFHTRTRIPICSWNFLTIPDLALKYGLSKI